MTLFRIFQCLPDGWIRIKKYHDPSICYFTSTCRDASWKWPLRRGCVYCAKQYVVQASGTQFSYCTVQDLWPHRRQLQSKEKQIKLHSIQKNKMLYFNSCCGAQTEAFYSRFNMFVNLQRRLFPLFRKKIVYSFRSRMVNLGNFGSAISVRGTWRSSAPLFVI